MHLTFSPILNTAKQNFAVLVLTGKAQFTGVLLTLLNSDLKQTWTATKRKACMPGRGEMELEERLLARKYKLKNK